MGPVVFDGKSAHAVEPFSGQRWSAVFYSCCADYDLCEGVQQAAENLGFRVPDARALERMKAKLEAQPQGHSTGSADAAAAGRRAGGVENGRAGAADFGFEAWAAGWAAWLGCISPEVEEEESSSDDGSSSAGDAHRAGGSRNHAKAKKEQQQRAAVAPNGHPRRESSE